MGLIINDAIQKMIAGYPTVSDKYNVSGGILGGDTAVKFGELVKVTDTAGYFKPAAGAASIDEIAGFALATNVKLAEGFPGTVTQINPGEAFNLMLNGFIAVELDADATLEKVTPNAKVYIILATGKLTTADKADTTKVVELTGYTFTGVTEMQGTAKVAEIFVK